ncbi:MAG: hypothetical protein ACE5GY_00820 [Thermodesulfobacteriota bacterium]
MMDRKGMEKRVTFRMDDGRYRLLADFADREGFSVSLVVRSLVYRYLEDVKRLKTNRGLQR